MYRIQLLTVLVALALMTTACRTTHDASADEISTLNEVSSTIEMTGNPGDDQGDASVGAIFSVYPIFQILADRDNTTASANALTQRPTDHTYMRAAMRAFEDCVDQGDNSVNYNDCGWSGSGDGGALSFSLAGFYNWTDSSSESDLLFDLSVGNAGFSAGTNLEWQGNSNWTATTFDGDFHLHFGIDINLLGANIPGTGSDLDIKATFETLTWADDCSTPVGGIIDWKSTIREGTDPVERRHVTVEYLDCEAATITW